MSGPLHAQSTLQFLAIGLTFAAAIFLAKGAVGLSPARIRGLAGNFLGENIGVVGHFSAAKADATGGVVLVLAAAAAQMGAFLGDPLVDGPDVRGLPIAAGGTVLAVALAWALSEEVYHRVRQQIIAESWSLPPRPEPTSMFKLVYLLVADRALFLEHVRTHREATQAAHEAEREWRQQHGFDDLPTEYRQSESIVRSLSQSLLAVAATIALAFAIAWVLAELTGGGPPRWLSRSLLASGVGILLWATLGKGGWSIQTVDGESLPEELDRFVFRALHLLGSFLLVLAGTWESTSYWAD